MNDYLKYIYRTISILIIAIFVCQPVEVSGQTNRKTLFADSLHLTIQHQKFKTSEHITPQNITDFYLSAFSKSIPRILEYTKYSIHWKQHLTMDEEQVKVKVKGLNIRGNHKYRGFPMDNYLFPQYIAYYLIFDYKDHKLTISDTIDMQNKGNAVIKIPDRIKLKDLQYKQFIWKVIYTNQQLEGFKKATKAIDQYYKDFPLLKQTLEKVAAISSGNLNMLPIYSANLREAETTLEQLKNRDYIQLLNLKAYDPLKFIPRFKNLKSGIAFKRQRIDRQMKIIDRLYYQEGINYLRTDTAIARGYFEKSVQANKWFSPSYLQLAKLNLSQNQLYPACQNIEYILLELKPDTQTYNQVMKFNKKLVERFIDRGKKLMEKEDFNQAVKVMERIDEFCNKTPGYSCSPRVEKNLSRARYGIYNAYVSVAKQALNNDKPEIALEYIRLVDQFQQENSNSIISNTEIKQLYTKTAKLLSEKGKYYLNINDYRSALSHLQLADSLCKTKDCHETMKQYLQQAHMGVQKQFPRLIKEAYNAEQFKHAKQLLKKAEQYQLKHEAWIEDKYPFDNLERKIDLALYRRHLERGYSYLNFDRPETALSEFSEAKCLLKQNHFQANDSLNRLMAQAAEPLILSAIERGKLKLWGKNYDESEAILTEIEKDTSKYFLGDNEKIKKETKLYTRKLVRELCPLAEDTFTNYLKRMRNNLKAHQYQNAQFYLNKTIHIQKKYHRCSLDTAQITNIRQKYQPYFKYSSMKKGLDSLVKAKNYSEVRLRAVKMEEYFNRKNLNSQNIVKVTATGYAIKSNDHDFKLFMTRYFLNKKQARKAIKVIRSIDRQKLSPETSKHIQVEVAKQIALEDAAKPGKIDYKTQSRKYTNGQDWLSKFERTYRSEYRKEAGIFPWFF